MTFTEDVIEDFIVCTQSTSLLSQSAHINRPSGVSTLFSGKALDLMIAAGWANRWGSSLFRLKYGLDAALYQSVLIEYRRIALEDAHQLGWPDDELTAFMAEFVLLAWLVDRRLWVRGELIERAEIMRKMLTKEEQETANSMAKALL